MEPIINPWLVYMVSVFSKLGLASFLITALSGLICGFTLFIGIMEGDIFEEDAVLPRKIVKWSLISTIVFGTMTILVPGEETLLTMLALQYVTPDNIQAVQSNIVDFVKSIAQAVKNVGS